MHPYEIAQTLRFRAKHDSVRLNFGSLYAVVESLERRGLIRALDVVREGRRPERTIYEITDLGIREATEWLSELLSVPQKEYPQFLAALSFLPALPHEEVVALLRNRAQALEVHLVMQRAGLGAARDAGLPRLFGLEGEYEIALGDAELAFIRGLIDDIDSGALDGLEIWRSFHLPSEMPRRYPFDFGKAALPLPPSPPITMRRAPRTIPACKEPDARAH
jgi:DNA-binding PadR family transcriptional regulator